MNNNDKDNSKFRKIKRYPTTAEGVRYILYIEKNYIDFFLYYKLIDKSFKKRLL